MHPMHPMHRLLPAYLAIAIIQALAVGPGTSLLATAAADDFEKPAGVTPTVDSENEPVDPRLSIEFNRRYQDLRSGSPLSIDWTLKWRGTRLPKGYLDVHIVQGRRIRGRLISRRQLVLTNSGTRFRTLLPPFNTDSDPFSPLDIRAFFISDAGTFPLGERSLRVAGPLRRSFVVAFCEAWQNNSSPEEIEFTNSLGVESQLAQSFAQHGNDANQRMVATYPARIYPADVPANPLWLCEFNLLVLLPDGLRDLRRNQLQAISKWVDAGGSLGVFVNGPLDKAHEEFVNRLARSHRSESLLTLDRDRQPHLTQNPSRLHKGLGRVVIHQELPLQDGFRTSTAWNTSVAFLWSRRHEVRTAHSQSPPLTTTRGLLPGIDTPTPLRPMRPQTPATRPAATAITLEAPPPTEAGNLTSEIKWRLTSVSSLVRRLTPDDFEVVPMWLLGLLLVTYVVVIGPVDYVVLGWLQLRKWTWIVFPLTTLAFTMLIIWMSHEYMGTSGDARRVLFRDIGDDGQLVRENRFELHLSGSHTTLVTNIEHGLFTPINYRGYLSVRQFDPGQRFRANPTLAEPTEYVGTIPSEYAAIQDLPQWSPQVNRVFRIAPPDPVPAFDWDRVRPEQLASDADARARFHEAVRGSFGPHCRALLFHGDLNAKDLWQPKVPLFLKDLGIKQSQQRRPGMWYEQGLALQANRGFLRDSCVRPSLGVFRVVSRVSPHGGDNFEDLAMLDPTDPGQWLLVIAVAEDNNLILYRHLYHDLPHDPTTVTHVR
jgi:hypothetical protein